MRNSPKNRISFVFRCFLFSFILSFLHLKTLVKSTILFLWRFCPIRMIFSVFVLFQSFHSIPLIIPNNPEYLRLSPVTRIFYRYFFSSWERIYFFVVFIYCLLCVFIGFVINWCMRLIERVESDDIITVCSHSGIINRVKLSIIVSILEMIVCGEG